MTDANSILDDVPEKLPALLRTMVIFQKVADVGFSWPDLKSTVSSLEEEVAELKEAILEDNTQHIEHELGDVFLSAIELARYLKIDSETCLQKATNRFSTRFRYMEKRFQEEDKSIKKASFAELSAYWKEAKHAEAIKQAATISGT